MKTKPQPATAPDPAYTPPDHLSDRAKAMWDSVVPSRCKSPERLLLLQVALESFDRATEARLAVDREGLTKTTATTGAIHLHPLLRVERESRQMFGKLWAQLNLQWNTKIDGLYQPF